MATILKHVTRKLTIRNFNFKKIVMASSTKTENAVEGLKNNPYYEKYATKIAVLQQTSPEEFLSRIEANEKAKKPKPSTTSLGQYSSLLKPKEKLSTQGSENEKKLADIMKTDLIKDKDGAEIERIWKEYHMQRDVIAATIPSETYNTIFSRSSKYPTFLFPLPRNQGYEFIMCQFSKNTVHFTPLICYQVHKENAPECLTITHYTEFKDDKNIVLMRGEFDKDVINVKEAQCLANQLQFYYGQNNERKLQLLETFTNKPDDFKHMDLISELENLSL